MLGLPLVLALGLGLSMVVTTVSNVYAITVHESGTFLECLGTGVSLHESYACDRIALYMAGECERTGQVDWPCDSVTEYVQGHGLQGERRLSQNEVVEDFRIIDRPETEEEKTFTEGLFDDYPGLQNGE